MVAAHEVLMATSPVRNLVKEGKSNQLRNQIVTGLSFGMQTLEMSLNDLIHGGLTSYEEAVARASFPREVEQPLPVRAR